MGEWKDIVLGRVASIKIGGTPARDIKEYWDTNLEYDNPWVSIRDMNNKYLESTAEYITDLGVHKSNSKPVGVDEVLLSFKLSIGKVSLPQRVLFTNEAIAAIHSDTIDRDFLFQGLQYWNLLQDVDQAIKGKTLNKNKLNKLVFHIPSDPAEQQKIAQILTKADDAIQQTERLIAKYEVIRTGLMQDLLTRGIDEAGNIRSEETHAFKDSELGRIPVEWEVLKFDEVCDKIIDCPHSTPKYLKSGYYVARTMHIKDGEYDYKNSSFVSEEGFKKRVSRGTPEAGDIIFTREAPVGEAFVIPKGLKICLGQRVMLFKINSEFDSSFIVDMIYSEIVHRRIEKKSSGTTNPHLNVSDLKSFKLAYPKLAEQKVISKKLLKLRNKLNHLRNELSKLQDIKTALMQDLLTGNKRVDSLLE